MIKSKSKAPVDDRDARLSRALDGIIASQPNLTLVGLAEAHGDGQNVSSVFASEDVVPPEEALTPLLSLLARLEEGTVALIISELAAGVYFIAVGSASNEAKMALYGSMPNKSKS